MDIIIIIIKGFIIFNAGSFMWATVYGMPYSWKLLPTFNIVAFYILLESVGGYSE